MTSTYVGTQSLTWAELAGEAYAIAGAWVDHADELVALADRIAEGRRRLDAAHRAGNLDAAGRIDTRLAELGDQARSLDAMARRLLLIRGLLILRDLAGPGLRVTVDAEDGQTRVVP